MKPILDGAIAGVAGGILSNWLGGYGRPAGHLAVGYFRKNNTLKTIGGVELGEALAGGIGGMFGGNGGGGFFHS